MQSETTMRRVFLYINIALVFCLTILTIFPHHEFLQYIAIVISGLVSVFSLIACVVYIKELSLAYLYSTAILLAYALGALNTLIKFSQVDVEIYEYFSIQVGQISSALIMVLMSVLIINFYGRLTNSRIFDFLLDRPKILWTDLIFPFASIMLMLLAYALGHLGHQGSAVSDEGTISPLAAFAIALSIPTLGYLAYIYEPADNVLRKWILCIGVVLLILLVPQGRRVVMYVGVIILFSLRLGGVKFNYKSGKFLLITLLTIIFFLVSMKLFFAMRLAKWSLGDETPIMVLLDAGFQIMLNSEAYALDDQISENVAFRTFIIEYLALLLDKFNYQNMMFGDVLKFNFELAVPSLFNADKWAVLQYIAEEDFVHPRINLPYWDAANSVYTAGVADFGFIGGLLYPMLFLMIFEVIIYTSKQITTWQVSVFLCFAVVNELLNIETVVATYFVTTRNALAVLFLMYIYYKFYTKKNLS